MKFQEVLKHCILVAVMFGLAGSVQAQPTMTAELAKQDRLPADNPYCGAYGITSGRELVVLPLSSSDDYDPLVPSCVDIDLSSVTALPDGRKAPNFDDGNDVGVVDWVLVEVRAAEAGTEAGSFDSGTVMAQIPALLLSSGLVVDAMKFFSELDGTARTTCATVGAEACADADVDVPADAFPVGQDIRLVLRHRNHLDVMSASTVPDTAGVREVDFSVTANIFTPAGRTSVWQFEDGVTSGTLARILQSYPNSAFMVPGDTDGDGNVRPGDVTGPTGYVSAEVRARVYASADTNLDDRVRPNDVTERGYVTARSGGATRSYVP